LNRPVLSPVIPSIDDRRRDDIADVKSTLADHTKILNDHTRDVAVIKKDLTTNLDKRLQLEVRVSAIEQHLGLDKKIGA
jgi:hypothetical protein